MAGTQRFSFMVPIILLLAGAITTYFGHRMYTNAKVSTDWPSVTGKITHSEVDSERKTTGSGKRRRTRTMYSADVRYRYLVDGKPYSGQKVSFGEVGSSSSGSARKIVNRYPVSREVPVFYNPEEPELSVLEPGTSWSSMLPLGIGILFILVGLASLVPGVRSR